MNFGIKHFWEETPKIARKFGWYCLLLSASIEITAHAMEIPWLKGIAIGTGIAGKFISDCFAEKPKN